MATREQKPESTVKGNPVAGVRKKIWTPPVVRSLDIVEKTRGASVGNIETFSLS
ncbi:hypothetical protein F11_07540 [Rhodospirillum rubrum F11]|nr:hypothetical protein F11_07540 [Rhodospirillum rubrum F11]